VILQASTKLPCLCTSSVSAIPRLPETRRCDHSADTRCLETAATLDCPSTTEPLEGTPYPLQLLNPYKIDFGGCIRLVNTPQGWRQVVERECVLSALVLAVGMAALVL
jgi:hypothetical protein